MNDLYLPPIELFLLMFTDGNRVCPPLWTGALRSHGAGMREEWSTVPGVVSVCDKNWHLLMRLLLGLALSNVNIASHIRIIQVIYSSGEKAATPMSCSLFTTDLNRSAFQCFFLPPIDTSNCVFYLKKKKDKAQFPRRSRYMKLGLPPPCLVDLLPVLFHQCHRCPSVQ